MKIETFKDKNGYLQDRVDFDPKNMRERERERVFGLEIRVKWFNWVERGD